MGNMRESMQRENSPRFCSWMSWLHQKGLTEYTSLLHGALRLPSTPLSLWPMLPRAVSAEQVMIVVTLMSSQVAGAFPLGVCLSHTSPSPESL